MNRTNKLSQSRAEDSRTDKPRGCASGEKQSRRSTSRRTATGALLLMTILLLCAGLTSCVASEEGQPGAVHRNFNGDDFTLTELEIENAYFQGVAPMASMPMASLPLKPSFSYWLKKGDHIELKWDRFEFHWAHDGKTCEFPDNNSTNDCRVCNFCAYDHDQCLGTLLAIEEGDFTIARDSSFRTEDATNTLFNFRLASDVVSACSNDTTHSPPTIQPEKSGQYRIATRLSNVKINGAAQGRVKVYVLDPSKPDVTSYAMQRHSETAYPDRVWYQFSVTGDDFWEDNFSKNLHVTRVRFLKGKPTMDANTGRFKLDDNYTVVRPSRVVLIPTFDENGSAKTRDEVRCYAAPSTVSSDGDINLTRCRQVALVNCPSSDPTCHTEATPSYLGDRTAEKLTWFAEFYPCEACGSGCVASGCPSGATEPVLGEGEVLAIEFTLETL